MLEIFSVDSSVLTPHDLGIVQDGFSVRIQCSLSQIPTLPHRLDPCDLTIAYDGDRQAVFVRERDAHKKRCDCCICTRVRELLDGSLQELTSRNIWGPTTRLLPFDERGDRRIFLAHVAHSICDHINTDPPPTPYVPPEGFDVCLPLTNGGKIDLETGRVRRDVAPEKITPVGHLGFHLCQQ